MAGIMHKIPGLRSIAKALEKRRFKKLWRKANAHNDTKAGERIFPLKIVEVGRGSYGTLNVFTMYAAPNEKVSIGHFVSIAPNVSFMLGMNHQTQTVTTFPFYSKLVKRSPIDAICKGPIRVEDEVWIGASTFISSGITIGKGAIVATGSVVTKDVPPYAIVGGNPARIIRYRFSDEIIEILKPVRLADFPESWIRENIDLIYTKIETVEDALRFRAVADAFQNKQK